MGETNQTHDRNPFNPLPPRILHVKEPNMMSRVHFKLRLKLAPSDQFKSFTFLEIFFLLYAGETTIKPERS